jgi:two-component system sensor histidine kinase HydH
MVMADDKTQAGKGEELEQLSKLTGQLAHEIKNPLSTIKINLRLISEELADLIASGERSPDKADSRLGRAFRKISVVEKETDRLEQILDGFLRYLDRTELQPANIDLNELISDMIDFYLPQASSHSITMRQALCREKLICRLDADMIKQVILNLFINSQQAMPGGGELMIRTYSENQNAVIQISDTGCGITPENLPHIFDAYYSSRPNGSGLGLPTAKKIIQQHGGTIKVESEPGKGTVFTIKLPVLK